MRIMNEVQIGQQYVANSPDQPLRIGPSIRVDDKQSLPSPHFNEVYTGVNPTKYPDT